MPHRHRIALAGTAVSLGAAVVLVPAGAGAHTRPAVQPAVATTINGATTNAPIFVRCAPSVVSGNPLARNTIATTARPGLGRARVTVAFLDDRSAPVTLPAGASASVPATLRLPCSGTGTVRVRSEWVTNVRLRVVRRIRGRRRVSFVTKTVVQLLSNVTARVVFVGTAS